MPEQDKRERGVIMVTLHLYTSAKVLVQACSFPCSGSSPALLHLATDTTRQAGDEELASETAETVEHGCRDSVKTVRPRFAPPNSLWLHN